MVGCEKEALVSAPKDAIVTTVSIQFLCDS